MRRTFEEITGNWSLKNVFETVITRSPCCHKIIISSYQHTIAVLIALKGGHGLAGTASTLPARRDVDSYYRVRTFILACFVTAG